MKTLQTVVALVFAGMMTALAQQRAAPAEGQANAEARPARQWQRPDGANGGRMMGGGFDQNMLLLRLFEDPQMAEALKLSAEQKDALKTAAAGLNERQDKVNEALRVASLEQAALAAKILADKEAGTDELMALVEKIGGLRTDLAKIQTERLLVIRNVLSAEQVRDASEHARQRMEQLRERMRERQGAMERGERGQRDGGQRGEREMQRGQRDGGQRGMRRDRRDNRPLPERPAGWDE